MSSEPVKICLICMDRTGSNMISSRLDTHRDIVFYNEIFHRQYVIFNDQRVAAGAEILARRDKNPSAFVSAVWRGEFEEKSLRTEISGIGFKLFLNHNAEALRYVINSDSKIIFLRRRNALARFSSFKIASLTSEWKATTQTRKKDVKVNFNANEFRAYLQNFLSLEMLFEMTLNRWSRAHFSVFYEDIVARPEVWTDMIRYLGFRREDFGESALLKQNTSDVLARFSNPDQVRDFVCGIGRYDWLSE